MCGIQVANRALLSNEPPAWLGKARAFSVGSDAAANRSFLPRRSPWLGNGETEINRLLDCRTGVVLSRAAQLFPSGQRAPYGQEVKDMFPIGVDNWDLVERENLAAAAQNPTKQELEDVTLIDNVFGFIPTHLPVNTGRMVYDVYRPNYLGYLRNLTCYHCESTLQKCYQRPRWGTIPGPGYQNPFYCTGATGLPPVVRLGFGGTWPNVYEYFNLDPNALWSEQRLAFYNTKVLYDVLGTYPFPAPIPAAPGFWYHSNRGALAELAHSGLIITPPLARMLITAFTLNTYKGVSEGIVKWAEDKAEHQKKWAIIRLVGVAAVGLVWAAALGPLLASIIPAGVPVTGATLATTVTGLAQEEFSDQELEAIAEDLEQTARVFEVNDPLFAEEVRKLVDTLTYLREQLETSADAAEQIAQQKANPPPTPAEVGVNPDYPFDEKPTPLLGAAAGMGLIGLLYLFLK